MTICYFGNYDPDYARNRVIMRGLQLSGVTIIQCNVRGKGVKTYWRLVRAYKRLGAHDLVIVGQSGEPSFIPVLARLLSKKPVVWDAFYSLYDSWVFDRQRVKKGSLKALYYWFLDWINCRSCDRIVLDTQIHIAYFVETFQIPLKKCIRVLVGTDDTVFFPKSDTEQKLNNVLHVYFHGKYIPLQGVSYIIEAAHILLKYPDITFTLVGTGQTYEECARLVKQYNLTNVHLVNKVPYNSLPAMIAAADVCLGIFGDTPKTQRVIPNKVYECAAMKKPVISGDTPAIRELFTGGENIVLCNTADAHDLAEKILMLRNNAGLRAQIAEAGFELFKGFASPAIVVKPLIEALSILVPVQQSGI